ncbi:MAG: DUF1553 domain-containing protein [Planctomycetes bacterium]|nr:DUF1553 domain-containing protein [Planctomycetota bacterium]
MKNTLARVVAASISIGSALAWAWPATSDSESARAPTRVSYDRDIRPLLSDRCFRCHGPESTKRQAQLRLDTFEGATAEHEGRRAIVPGQAERGEMWRRLTSHDDNVRMPPPSSNKRAFDAAELELLRRWIDAGAEYEPHWSFVAAERPRVPSTADRAWPANDVDRFVLARLEDEGVRPSPRTDDASLARRLFLDLTGLPPTPDELAAFAADTRPDKLRHWARRIFGEEPYKSRFAERMATPWLDAARYADTSGIHMDAGRQIWPWRDWVLAAYRDNMPFDRFVVEQIAGDLLPGATQEQQIASGFHRNHVTTDEGGAINEEYLVEYAVDRTATTGSVFLALTLGCARCHEHKFDPVTQDEFYSFYAFFNSNEEPGLYSQVPDANRALEPFMEVPRPEQVAGRTQLEQRIADARGALERTDPAEDAQRNAFFAGVADGVAWRATELVSATSANGATLEREPDGSVLASGANPERDDFELTLRTDATDLRLLALHALTDASLPNGRVGRAENGNAVLTGVEVEVRSLADAAQTRRVRFEWAWADHEQPNGDFRVINVLDTSDSLGWAVQGHQREGPRAALLLADEPFGFEGGSEIVVRLQHRSIYARHTLGRVRVHLGAIREELVQRLPAASSGWFVAGPFDGARESLFATEFGPEKEARWRRDAKFGERGWRHDEELLDGRANPLAEGVNVSYVAKRLFVPTARKLEVALGSDDGLRVFVDAHEAFANDVERGLAPNQDRAALELERGERSIVLKVVNTGGQAGFFWSEAARDEELSHGLVAALLPAESRWPDLDEALAREWRVSFSPDYRAATERLSALEGELAALRAQIPRTMVMKELATPRATFTLKRGQYDQPDRTRPAARGVPVALGTLPAGAPRDRLGLAQWLVAPENPLVARVAVNRLWELVFGAGIVRTTEDFGMQGEYPSHPELLDWLAVEFRESGWNVQHVLELLVTSSTYAQSSTVRADLLQRDPDNRWLARFPRRRLSAEAIRDTALHVSGLLVERFGGPSVKPYQPDGLWQEVAMVQSNTRFYVRGAGDELWRRSLYTYWKRACPPPAMLALDAPTREFCNIRRSTTNTPLQALVLWNDEQFLEAARALAQRTLRVAGDDDERLASLYTRCTCHAPEADELALLRGTLAYFRERYANSLDDARALIEIGESPTAADLDPAELAAWTLIASSVLNLDAVICRS